MNRPAAKAMRQMIIDHSRRLHPRVDDDGPDELETALLQCICDRLRERALRRHGTSVLNWFVADEVPGEMREVLAGISHRHVRPRSGDRRRYFGFRPDNGGVLEQPGYIHLGEAG